MDNQYTPGPWTAGGKKPYKGNEMYIFESSNPEKLIAYLGYLRDFSKPSIDEAIKNAYLIAAAPDLLEALKEILRFKHELATVMGERLQSPENFLKALEEGEKAITKALKK